MRDYVGFAVLWAALTAAGYYLARGLVQALPVVASEEGSFIDNGFAFILYVLVPVFTFVVAMLLYGVLRFRARSANEGEVAAPRDSRAFSWTWFVITAAINVLVIVHPGITGIREVFGNPTADLVVRANATQWSWSFDYPEYGIEGVNQLVLPEGRRVKVEINSDDVLHSFWVPAFRMKMDAVPGKTTTLYITPNRVISTNEDPTVRVQCAELCGTGHASMRAVVRVLEADEFDQWIQAQQ